MQHSIFKTINVLAFTAIVFLQFVDLAVFDAGHQHHEDTLTPVFALQTAHDHHHTADEHPSKDGITAHAGIHAALGDFSVSHTADYAAARILPVYERDRVNRLKAVYSGPPVPPPLS